MSKTTAQTAQTAHRQLLDRLNGAETADQLAAVLGTVTHLDKPGFPLNLPDGDYYDGAFYATFRGGEYAMTQTYGGPRDVLTERFWSLREELHRRDVERRHAERDAARDTADAEKAARRGRPEIGRPIQVRMPEWLIASIDRYADKHDLTRPEAIRKLIVAGGKALHAEITETTTAS